MTNSKKFNENNDFEFDEKMADRIIDKLLKIEKNSGRRYNPFLLNSKTPSLKKAIKRDFSKEPITNLLKKDKK